MSRIEYRIKESGEIFREHVLTVLKRIELSQYVQTEQFLRGCALEQRLPSRSILFSLSITRYKVFHRWQNVHRIIRSNLVSPVGTLYRLRVQLKAFAPLNESW